MTKKDIFIQENKWSKTGECFLLYGDFFENFLSINDKILLIGTGWTDEQYYDWPRLLLKLEPTLTIHYLEISEIYINKWKEKEFQIIKGDVRNIDNIINKNIYDIICWMQGPEHIKQEEMLSTFDKIFSIAKKAVIFSCPWGKYYDFQEEIHGNVYEKHINKDMDKHCFIDEGFNNYNISYCDKKDSGNGGIIITRFKK